MTALLILWPLAIVALVWIGHRLEVRDHALDHPTRNRADLNEVVREFARRRVGSAAHAKGIR